MSFHTHPLAPAGDSRQCASLRRVARGAAFALCMTSLIASGVDALAAPQTSGSTPTGPVEITQAKALNGNVTPGDTAGFPITISAPGSYKLMGNLTVLDLNTTAIVITASDVTLDLNGFAILGPQACTGFPFPSCTPGTGDGISIATPNPGYSNIAIQNGTVRGMGRHGLFDGNLNRVGVVVDRVRALQNAGDGMSLTGALVTNSVANENGKNGFFLWGSNLQSSSAMANGGYGLSTEYLSAYGANNFLNNGGAVYGGAKQTAGNNCTGAPCP